MGPNGALMDMSYESLLQLEDVKVRSRGWEHLGKSEGAERMSGDTLMNLTCDTCEHAIWFMDVLLRLLSRWLTIDACVSVASLPLLASRTIGQRVRHCMLAGGQAADSLIAVLVGAQVPAPKYVIDALPRTQAKKGTSSDEG